MVTQNARPASHGTLTQNAVVAGPDLPSPPVTERPARSLPGLPMLVLGLILLLAFVALFFLAGREHGALAKTLIAIGVLGLIADGFLLRGLVAVVPGQARVVQLFGSYRGTIRRPRPALREPVQHPAGGSVRGFVTMRLRRPRSTMPTGTRSRSRPWSSGR